MKQYIKDIIHKATHLLGIQQGRIVSWYNDDVLYIAFMCDSCGKFSGTHKASHFNVGIECEKENEE